MKVAVFLQRVFGEHTFDPFLMLCRGLLQIVVNVKVNKYHCFCKCITCLIPRVPILGFCQLRFVVRKKSCCCHFYIP